LNLIKLPNLALLERRRNNINFNLQPTRLTCWKKHKQYFTNIAVSLLC